MEKLKNGCPEHEGVKKNEQCPAGKSQVLLPKENPQTLQKPIDRDENSLRKIHKAQAESTNKVSVFNEDSEKAMSQLAKICEK